MRRLLLALTLLATVPLVAQTAPAPAAAPATEPLSSLDFLLGTWVAATNTAAGASGGTVVGTYTFNRDLSGHAIQRTGTVASCKGPADFDCNHHDQLTIFPDPHGAVVHGSSIFALYLDNEGHVIYYTVSTPDAHTVIFDSQGPPLGTKFRLTYHLEGAGPKAVMTGKFQGTAPGSNEYHSYFEWSGTKQ